MVKARRTRAARPAIPLDLCGVFFFCSPKDKKKTGEQPEIYQNLYILCIFDIYSNMCHSTIQETCTIDVPFNNFMA
jgi:hypothetical protein